MKLEEGKQQRLLEYLGLIDHWNRSVNLTAVRGMTAMVTRHLLDTLSVAKWIIQPRVLDIGSGAGLPGIPLAINSPDQQWYLLDSSNKRAGFLRTCCRELGLENVEVVHSRIEDFQPAEPLPAVTARAFASLVEIADNASHLLQSRGLVWAMKGRFPAQETTDLPDRFRVQEVIPIQVPGLHEERHLVKLQYNPDS